LTTERERHFQINKKFYNKPNLYCASIKCICFTNIFRLLSTSFRWYCDQASVIFLLLYSVFGLSFETFTVETNCVTPAKYFCTIIVAFIFHLTNSLRDVSPLYRLSDRRLSAKLVSNFADREWRVISAAEHYDRQSRYSRPEPLLFH
jgi:hypothetical protein